MLQRGGLRLHLCHPDSYGDRCRIPLMVVMTGYAAIILTASFWNGEASLHGQSRIRRRLQSLQSAWTVAENPCGIMYFIGNSGMNNSMVYAAGRETRSFGAAMCSVSETLRSRTAIMRPLCRMVVRKESRP